MQDFMKSDAVVKSTDSHRCLGFAFPAVQNMSFGAGFLVAAARKARFARRQRCASLGTRDPAFLCKLVDTLVLPILSYVCKVWAQVFCHGPVRFAAKSEIAKKVVLAELGCFLSGVAFGSKSYSSIIEH